MAIGDYTIQCSIYYLNVNATKSWQKKCMIISNA